jgi:hypothetical protein
MYKIRFCFPVFQLVGKNSQGKSLAFGDCLLSGLSVDQCAPKFESLDYYPPGSQPHHTRPKVRVEQEVSTARFIRANRDAENASSKYNSDR